MLVRSLPLLCAALLAACASAPTARALQDADYGAPPDGATDDRIRAAFAPLLLESGSADFRFASPERGWVRDGNGFTYGWVVWTQVNSKNRFGAFTGWRTYKVLTTSGAVHSIHAPKGDDSETEFERVR